MNVVPLKSEKKKEPAAGELIGVAEVRRLTGVSAVTMWRRYTATPPTFPAPAGYLLGSRRWRRSAIEHWVRTQLTRKPKHSSNLNDAGGDR